MIIFRLFVQPYRNVDGIGEFSFLEKYGNSQKQVFYQDANQNDAFIAEKVHFASSKRASTVAKCPATSPIKANVFTTLCQRNVFPHLLNHKYKRLEKITVFYACCFIYAEFSSCY